MVRQRRHIHSKAKESCLRAENEKSRARQDSCTMGSGHFLAEEPMVRHWAEHRLRPKNGARHSRADTLVNTRKRSFFTLLLQQDKEESCCRHPHRNTLTRRSIMSGSDKFYPFVYPTLNMLIQPGASVKISGLTSDAGQKLNGKIGVAKHFFLDSGRWLVDIDGQKSKIKIQNLVIDGVDVKLLFLGNRKSPDLVQAGTSSDGVLTLCILDYPLRPGFDIHAIKERTSLMGFSPELLDQAVKMFEEAGKTGGKDPLTDAAGESAKASSAAVLDEPEESGSKTSSSTLTDEDSGDKTSSSAALRRDAEESGDNASSTTASSIA